MQLLSCLSVPPAIYSEPRFHESFIVRSQQSVLGTSVGKTRSFFNTQPVNNTYRCIVRVVKWKHICRFVSSLLGPCVKLNKGIKYILWFQLLSFKIQSRFRRWIVVIAQFSKITLFQLLLCSKFHRKITIKLCIIPLFQYHHKIVYNSPV